MQKRLSKPMRSLLELRHSSAPSIKWRTGHGDYLARSAVQQGLIGASKGAVTFKGVKALADGHYEFDATPPGPHGGRRPGAGVKAEISGLGRRVELYLDQATIEAFTKAGGGNMSLGARRCAKGVTSEA